MKEYALEIKGLVKSFPNFFLDHINLHIPCGCVVGIIGENGAGKSTTIKSILNIINHNEGEILFYGKPFIAESKVLREEIGVVLDECCFPETLTYKQIDHFLSKIYTTWNKQLFYSYMNRFQLPINKKIKEYSRGMRMKLSIAVALSHDSKLLLLDEATSGLDPVVRDEILELFLEFLEDETHSILISSHILSDLEKISDYIAYIKEGKLILFEEKDVLLEEHGILKCSKDDFANIAKEAIIGTRVHTFGVEALVRKKDIPKGYTIDPASLEDILLYTSREVTQ